MDGERASACCRLHSLRSWLPACLVACFLMLQSVCLFGT